MRVKERSRYRSSQVRLGLDSRSVERGMRLSLVACLMRSLDRESKEKEEKARSEASNYRSAHELSGSSSGLIGSSGSGFLIFGAGSGE